MKTYAMVLSGSLLLAGLAIAEQGVPSGVTAATSVAPQGLVCNCPYCCGAAVRICVPEPDKKKHEKVTYSAKCVEFCVKGCPGLGNPTHKDCQGCEVQNCPSCGQVDTKKGLIKKVKTMECDTYKCVPQTVCRE